MRNDDDRKVAPKGGCGGGSLVWVSGPRPPLVGSLRRRQEREARRGGATTRWDGDEGPFSWAEFVEHYGGGAGYWWWRAGDRLRWDGDEGPFSWPEFVECYGDADEAAYWWARSAWVAENARATQARRGPALLRRGLGGSVSCYPFEPP